MCDCNYRIEFYKAQVNLIEVVHKYLHETETPLAWSPDTQKTKLTEFRKRESQLRQMIGSDPTDEILAAVDRIMNLTAHR